MSSAQSASAYNLRQSWIYWLAWISILAFLYLQSGAWRLLNSPPSGNHTWANCDRAAQAWMFYQGQATLLFPATNYVGHHPSGIDSGEFPLISWGVSWLYRLFGFHEAIFRYATFLFSLVGFWFAADFSRKRIPNPWIALFIATGWLFSPNLVYYSVGFLPDMVAVSLFLGGIWTSSQSTRKYKVLGGLLFSLAILLKFNILIIYFGWVAAGLWAQEARLFSRNTMRQLPQVLLPILPGIFWIAWTWHLKSVYHGHVFTTSTRIPDSFSETISHLSSFWNSHIDYLYPRYLGVFWGILVMVLGGMAFLRNRRFGTAALCGLCGWILFFWAMGHLSPHHHYYHLILGPVIFMAMLELPKFPALQKSIGRTSIVVLFLGLICWSSFYLPETLHKTAFHIDGIAPGWYRIAEAPIMQQIPSHALVFTYADASPNISLYLMHRKGINGNADYPIWYLVKCMQECDYAVLTDPGLFLNPQISPLMDSYLGEHEGLHLYKLRHGNLTQEP